MSLPGWLDQERQKQDEVLRELNRLAVALEFSPTQTITPQQRQEFVLCVQNIETHFGKEAASFVEAQLGPSFSAMQILPGEVGTFQKALGECRTRLRQYLRRGRAIALVLLILSLAGAAVAFLVTQMGDDSISLYQQYEFTPHVGLEKENISYVLPALLTPGPLREKDAGRRTGSFPRWFSYQAELKNTGTRAVDVRALWMCAGPKVGECTHSFELRRTFSIEAGGRTAVSYGPSFPAEEPLLPDLVSLRFFLQIEVVGLGGKVGISHHKVGGFEENRPVIVREGTVVPEGTEGIFEIEFMGPVGEGTRTGRAQVEYVVQAIPD